MKDERKELAFVDMEFHRKTKSGDFLRELFSDDFIIHDFWFDGTIKSAGKMMKDLIKFEYIFFFQALMPYRDIMFLRKKNIKMIWAPMYDGLPMSSYFWNKMASQKIKLLCFSGAITQKARTHAIDHLSFRYFKKPAHTIPNMSDNGVNIFFWYRGNITFNDWIKYVHRLPINKIVYLSAPDPKFKQEVIAEDDIRKYNIVMATHTFLKHESYIEYVKECDIFVCPRRQEGIGMTVVEALSMGKFLCGYNDYTMIDYIGHKKNGFLFDEKTIDEITLSDIESSAVYREQIRSEGYSEWEAAAKKIPGLFLDYKYAATRSFSLANSYFFFVEWVKRICKLILGYTGV